MVDSREGLYQPGEQERDEADGRRERLAHEAPVDAAVDENRPADVLASETVRHEGPESVYRPNKLCREHALMPHRHADTPGEKLAEAEAEGEAEA